MANGYPCSQADATTDPTSVCPSRMDTFHSGHMSMVMCPSLLTYQCENKLYISLSIQDGHLGLRSYGMPDQGLCPISRMDILAHTLMGEHPSSVCPSRMDTFAPKATYQPINMPSPPKALCPSRMDIHADRLMRAHTLHQCVCLGWTPLW